MENLCITEECPNVTILVQTEKNLFQREIYQICNRIATLRPFLGFEIF